MDPLRADDPRMIGEYLLRARLGAGGMGRVYLGFSPAGRAVAVKLVHPQLAQDAAFLGRFRREVAAAQAVNGAYAAPVVAAGPDDDPPWLATAFVPGPTLQEYVTAVGPLPEDAVRKLGAGLAEALRAIHGTGLVHRDLKPGNVLLALDGPRVIDFGIARALDGTSVTASEHIVGTPQFMSPEQAQAQPTSQASDVFSLGCVLHFAATGANPFGDGHPAVLLYRIVHADPDLGGLPSSLRYVVAACLAKEPANRPAMAELSALLATEPHTVTAPHPVTELNLAQTRLAQTPAAFWPEPVTSLILQYQATLESALENPPTLPLDVPAGPTPLHPGAPRRVASRPAAPKSPASSPTRTTKNLHTQHTAPHMGRRRALATLAGMAAGGLAVAGWDLGPWRHHATSAHTTGTLSQDPAAKPLIKPGTKPGTQVWRYPVNSAVGALAVANGVVYAGTDENNIVALDGRTGKLLWRRATSTGFNEQLVVAGGFVVAADPDQGGMVAIGATTGTEAWSVPGKNEGILGLAAGAGAAFAGIAVHDNTTGGVTAYDPGTGTLLWTYEFGAVSDTNAGLVVAGRVLYGTTTNGDVFALDAARGTQLWRVTSKNVEYSFGPQSLLIDGGILYAAAKSAIHAVHTRTGKELWQAPGIPGAGLAMAGGTIFAGVTTGPMTASAGSMLAISAANGSRQWTNPVASGAYLVTPGPGDVVYSGSNAGVLDAWRASTGAKVWSFPTTGAPIASNIAVAGGGVFFGSNDHHVYAVAA